MNDHVKTFLDGLSVATVLATLTAWLPPVAAALSIVWTAIRIWETKTVQAWVKNWRAMK